MGREVTCTATWQGVTASAKVLLESTEIILRGRIRGRIPRAGITHVLSDGDVLVIDSSGVSLTLELGRTEALKWAAAISKTPPTLTEKLGLAQNKLAFVLGEVDDETLAGALSGATTAVLAEADMIVAVLRSDADLAAAFRTAQMVGLPVWLIGEKGKAARVPIALSGVS